MYISYTTNVNSKNTITITEARKRIFQLADDVQRQSNHYTLTEKGKPKAILMSADEFESWMETLEVMHEFPNILEDMKEADEDYKHGRVISLDDLLKEEKLDVLLNPRKKSKKKLQKTS